MKFTVYSVVFVIFLLFVTVSCTNDDDQDVIIHPCGGIEHLGYPTEIDSLSVVMGTVKQVKENESVFSFEKNVDTLGVGVLLKVENIKRAFMSFVRPVKSNVFFNMFPQAYACSVVETPNQKLESISIITIRDVVVNDILYKEGASLNSLFLVDSPWEEDKTISEFIAFQNDNRGVFGGYGSVVLLKVKDIVKLDQDLQFKLKVNFNEGKDFVFDVNLLNKIK